MEQEISVISKLPEKRTTSRDGPKFSKRISRKFLFHAIWTRTSAWNFGRMERAHYFSSSVMLFPKWSFVKLKEGERVPLLALHTQRKKFQPLQALPRVWIYLQARIHVLQRQLKVCSLPTCLVLKTQSVLHLLVLRVILEVTDFPSSTLFFTIPTSSWQGSSLCTPKNSKDCIHKAKCNNLQKKNRRLKGKV